MYDEEVISSNTDKLIVALCADYFRRKRLIDRKLAPYNVIMECRYLNYRILDAACSVVGAQNAERMIREIGGRVGYVDSALDGMSETTYKIKKKEVKRAIAKRLSLL